MVGILADLISVELRMDRKGSGLLQILALFAMLEENLLLRVDALL